LDDEVTKLLQAPEVKETAQEPKAGEGRVTKSKKAKGRKQRWQAKTAATPPDH
jgi:hypothetical protein